VDRPTQFDAITGPPCSSVQTVPDREPFELSRSGGRARALVRTVRSPESGVLGQGIRFVLSGGTVALVYLATTTILAELVGLPFQAALAIGFCFGLVVHFTLQRMFVWAHEGEFALPLRHQVGRYLVVALLQYAVTAASTALLPNALGISAELVYLATVGVVLATNFLVFRNGIFHAEPSGAELVGAPPSVRPPV
jgi:putative flippase GtrA